MGFLFISRRKRGLQQPGLRHRVKQSLPLFVSSSDEKKLQIMNVVIIRLH